MFTVVQDCGSSVEAKQVKRSLIKMSAISRTNVKNKMEEVTRRCTQERNVSLWSGVKVLAVLYTFVLTVWFLQSQEQNDTHKLDEFASDLMAQEEKLLSETKSLRSRVSDERDDLINKLAVASDEITSGTDNANYNEQIEELVSELDEKEKLIEKLRVEINDNKHDGGAPSSEVSEKEAEIKTLNKEFQNLESEIETEIKSTIKEDEMEDKNYLEASILQTLDLKELKTKLQQDTASLEDIQDTLDALGKETATFCEDCHFHHGGISSKCGKRKDYLMRAHNDPEIVAKAAVIKWDSNCRKQSEVP